MSDRNFITQADLVKHLSTLDRGQAPVCSLTYMPYNRREKRAGTDKIRNHVILARFHRLAKKYVPKTSTRERLKNPRHDHNFTLDILDLDTMEYDRVHIPFIWKFNGIEVL